MGKKTNNNEIQDNLKKLQLDFNEPHAFEKDNPVFKDVSKTQFQAKVIDALLTSKKPLPEVLDELIKWKEYLVLRSEEFSTALNQRIAKFFEKIQITLQEPFDESKWHERETMDEEDLNKKTILLNGIPFTTTSIVASLEKLLTKLNVKVEHVDVFPFDLDSYGLPPVNCKKIWNPLLWMRSEIESKIKKHCQPTKQVMDPLVTCLAKAPKEGHLKKLAITSFFLENTADNLDYRNLEDNNKFLFDLKQQFGTLEVDELTMVLPDILLAYTKDLLEGVMQVCYFIPFELLRLVFLRWRPRVVKMRLRTEACSSIEDAARIEWDEEDVFTSANLFNCALFDRCDPICLGKEDEIVNCKLVIDATGSRLLDPIYNEDNIDTAGRDLLILFPMTTILIKRTVTLKSGSSLKNQVKKQFDFMVDTMFFNAEQHQGRILSYQLSFLNAGDLQMNTVKKCLPRTANDRDIGVVSHAEPAIEKRFHRFAGPVEGKVAYVSYFDEANQFVIDLKIVLSN